MTATYLKRLLGWLAAPGQLAEMLTLGAPAALAVMGAVVAIWPPDPNSGFEKFCWVAAFVVVAFVGTLAAWRSSRSQKSDQQKLVALMTGGDNYCYFEIVDPAVDDGRGNYQLALTGSEGGPVFKVNYWISPAGSKSNKEYMSIDVRTPELSIVYPGRRAWGRFLPIGKYCIEFDGQNGSWVEALELELREGKIWQNIKIVNRDGRFRYSYGSVIDIVPPPNAATTA